MFGTVITKREDAVIHFTFCVTHLFHSKTNLTKIEDIYDSLMGIILTQSCKTGCTKPLTSKDVNVVKPFWFVAFFQGTVVIKIYIFLSIAIHKLYLNFYHTDCLVNLEFNLYKMPTT